MMRGSFGGYFMSTSGNRQRNADQHHRIGGNSDALRAWRPVRRMDVAVSYLYDAAVFGTSMKRYEEQHNTVGD